MTKKRVLFVITEDWAFISHRLHLANAALEQGYEVGVVTHVTSYRHILEESGLRVFNWRLERRSLNPFSEIFSIFQLWRVTLSFDPDIVHAVALKPVIYSGMAMKFSKRTKFFAALGGVGFIFTSKNLKATFLKPIVKLCLRFVLAGPKCTLILQNIDNVEAIVSLSIVDEKRIKLIKGAGVEIEKFQPSQIPNGVPMVILPARMLWDKGVAEFVRVAGRIKRRGIKARFVLVGDADSHNPASITQTQVDQWVQKGAVEHWSRRDDMVQIYQQASIVCLPSYNEGLPKVLLEAASCARPTVAFNVPGCREIVRDGLNGFLVSFGDETALEKAIINLINNRSLCAKMGATGRKIVEQEFSDNIINTQTLAIWNQAQ